MAQERQLEMVGPVPASAYSSAVKVKGGTLVFLAGIEPTDEQGKLVAPGDFSGQVSQIWKNMDKAMKQAGGNLEDVVSMTVFTTERRWSDQLTDMRREVFKKGFPASAFMEAAKLPTPGAFVEIRAIGVIPE
jgi:enamine deaminase RidA (YjgF/YER057c/UK114 family)